MEYHACGYNHGAAELRPRSAADAACLAVNCRLPQASLCASLLECARNVSCLKRGCYCRKARSLETGTGRQLAKSNNPYGRRGGLCQGERRLILTVYRLRKGRIACGQLHKNVPTSAGEPITEQLHIPPALRQANLGTANKDLLGSARKMFRKSRAYVKTASR